jgi:hypothetical protein
MGAIIPTPADWNWACFAAGARADIVTALERIVGQTLDVLTVARPAICA